MEKQAITIETADGRAPASLFRGEGQTGIILYMDAFGPRPALDQMAARMCALGHTLLVPDLFYRHGEYGPFDAKTAFSTPESAGKLRGIMTATKQAMTVADTQAFMKVLDDAGATGPLAAVGYCMGGARAINVAAANPDRFALAASLHGGNLASDAEDSPHRSVERIKGRVYVGVAGVDRSFPPEQSARLAEALRVAEVDHLIENYVGCAHGWAVPDHSVYDEEGAERHWRRLEMLFDETLRG